MKLKQVFLSLLLIVPTYNNASCELAVSLAFVGGVVATAALGCMATYMQKNSKLKLMLQQYQQTLNTQTEKFEQLQAVIVHSNQQPPPYPEAERRVSFADEFPDNPSFRVLRPTQSQTPPPTRRNLPIFVPLHNADENDAIETSDPILGYSALTPLPNSRPVVSSIAEDE